MSCEGENKYWNEKTFHFLDCAMATELMSTALLFEFRFVSLRTSSEKRVVSAKGPFSSLPLGAHPGQRTSETAIFGLGGEPHRARQFFGGGGLQEMPRDG